jgi:hypothetical protein
MTVGRDWITNFRFSSIKNELKEPWPIGTSGKRPMCVTEVCIRNTISFVNTKPIGEVLASLTKGEVVKAVSRST